MTTISRTFSVTPSPEVVVDYLKEFGHAVQWDPGTQQCIRNEPGPIAVGTSWHNVSKIAGVSTELTYTLTELSPNKIVLVGKNKTATSTDTIIVKPDGTGSEITYRADLDMHGGAKLAIPLIKIVFEKVGTDTVKQLTEVLNQLSPPLAIR